MTREELSRVFRDNSNHYALGHGKCLTESRFIDTVLSIIAPLEQTIAKLKTDLAERDEELNDMVCLSHRRYRKITLLSRLRGIQGARITRISNELRDARQTIAEKDAEIERIKKQNAELEEDSDTLCRAFKTASDDSCDSKEIIKGLRAELSQAKQEIERLKNLESVARMFHKIATKERDHERFTVSHLERELKETKERLSIADKCNEEDRVQMEQQDESLLKLMQTIDFLRSEIKSCYEGNQDVGELLYLINLSTTNHAESEKGDGK